jgi:hypothetical protein
MAGSKGQALSPMPVAAIITDVDNGINIHLIDR